MILLLQEVFQGLYHYVGEYLKDYFSLIYIVLIDVFQSYMLSKCVGEIYPHFSLHNLEPSFYTLNFSLGGGPSPPSLVSPSLWLSNQRNVMLVENDIDYWDLSHISHSLRERLFSTFDVNMELVY